MSKKYDILTPAERRVLRQVMTTKGQARTIRARNEALLKALEVHGPGGMPWPSSVTVDMGCPHCLRATRNCSHCSWNIPPLRKPHAKHVFSEFCANSTFGGVSADQAPFVVYAPSWAMVTFRNVPFDWDKCMEQSKTFVKGHMEWADAVLEGRWKCSISRKAKRGR
jgi:hypothetical protein